MSPVILLGLTAFLFLAIVGGIAGIIVEGRRGLGPDGHNPATRDAMWPIVGWGILFALYLAVEFVGDQNLTPEFKMQLGTLAILPFFYALLATARLIWRSARRIQARFASNEPVAWRNIPLLGRLAFPTLFIGAILSVGTELARAGASLSFLLLASVAVLLALIHEPTD